MPIILITTLCASYIFFCIVMALSADFGLITKNGDVISEKNLEKFKNYQAANNKEWP